MNKYKVCVYAICKNEESHIDRWYESMKEADSIYVLDTGSTDNSIELLKKNNIHYETCIINPWRFDEARNMSLDMVPTDTDICVCTDIDEVFNKGWRKELENIWNENIGRVKYKLNFSFDEYGNPATVLYISKIHKRNGFKWIHQVHEVLESVNNMSEIVSDNIVLNHYPDREKSRSNYLELLELSVLEEPDSDRNLHYLGREYMYNEMYNEAIDTFHKHLKHKNSLWIHERATSMRFMAKCYLELDRVEESELWYKNSVKECPILRESYVELGYLYYRLNEFKESIKWLKKALKIKDKSKDYINEDFAWNSFIYDLLSVNYYNIDESEEALKYIKKAIKLDPQNKRLIDNLDYMKKVNNI